MAYMSCNHIDLLEDLIKTSIWKPASIQEEPETKLTQWQVYLVESNKEGELPTIHLNGYAGYEGRVCSPIVEFDKTTRRGRTKSGRIYELVGEPGHNTDASYVWNRWLSIQGNPSFSRITDEYK